MSDRGQAFFDAKGGMGERTLRALRDCGAVYVSAIGGAAQFYVDRIEEVLGLDRLEFGGGSLHREIEEASTLELERLPRALAR